MENLSNKIMTRTHTPLNIRKMNAAKNNFCKFRAKKNNIFNSQDRYTRKPSDFFPVTGESALVLTNIFMVKIKC